MILPDDQERVVRLGRFPAGRPCAPLSGGTVEGPRSGIGMRRSESGGVGNVDTPDALVGLGVPSHV